MVLLFQGVLNTAETMLTLQKNSFQLFGKECKKFKICKNAKNLQKSQNVG